MKKTITIFQNFILPLLIYLFTDIYIYITFYLKYFSSTSVKNPLFDRVLPSVPKLPGFDFVLWTLLLSEHQHYYALRSICK